MRVFSCAIQCFEISFNHFYICVKADKFKRREKISKSRTTNGSNNNNKRYHIVARFSVYHTHYIFSCIELPYRYRAVLPAIHRTCLYRARQNYKFRINLGRYGFSDDVSQAERI